MNENKDGTERTMRQCWQNCGAELDDEILAIDALEDTLCPLDEETAGIRKLISGFEACYHEADVEAERIIKAIGVGRCPEASTQRPAQRKRELEICRAILSKWCEAPTAAPEDLQIAGYSAGQLVGFIGEPSPLKTWQVRRVVERVTEALDPARPYRRMALDMGDYGEPGGGSLGKFGEDEQEFLEQTKATFIHDTVDGREAKMSLAMAIDMMMPCHWDFAGSVVTILKAIGGDLTPNRSYTCCARNLAMSPLCDRLRTIGQTLLAFCEPAARIEPVDAELPALLGKLTPTRKWLAASLEKTLRLQLEAPSDFWLEFG